LETDKNELDDLSRDPCLDITITPMIQE